MGRQLRAAILLSAVTALGAAGTAYAYDWPQFGGDPAHSGSNTDEKSLGPDSVGRLAVLFKVSLPDVADGAAAYLGGALPGSGGLLFLTTRAGDILALDGRTGRTVWARRNPGKGMTVNNNGSRPVYTTASPALDPDRQHVYSYGLDGYVHRYAALTGEESRGSGWPELTTKKPFDEKGSSDLAVLTDRAGVSRLYVAHAGYPGDRGDYQGHLTVIDLGTGDQRVFNAVCSNQAVHFLETPGEPDCPAVQTGIWARAGVVYDGVLDLIFTATGNGTFDPARHHWADSVLALHPDGTGARGDPLSTWTPQSFAELDAEDADLGSTLPAILPPARNGGPRLAVQGGKDALLRVLDLSRLGGRLGPGHLRGELATVPVPQGGQVLTQPAVWTDPADGSAWLFVANRRGISGMQVKGDGAKPTLSARWTSDAGGTSPLVANNVLYYAGPAGLRALDPRTGRVLWQDAGVGDIHWESPIVADGRLYLTDEQRTLTAWGLP